MADPRFNQVSVPHPGEAGELRDFIEGVRAFHCLTTMLGAHTSGVIMHVCGQLHFAMYTDVLRKLRCGSDVRNSFGKGCGWTCGDVRIGLEGLPCLVLSAWVCKVSDSFRAELLWSRLATAREVSMRVLLDIDCSGSSLCFIYESVLWCQNLAVIVDLVSCRGQRSGLPTPRGFPLPSNHRLFVRPSIGPSLLS